MNLNPYKSVWEWLLTFGTCLSHSKLKWWLYDENPQQRKEHEEVEEKGKDNTQTTASGNYEFLDLVKLGKQWQPELYLYSDLTAFSIARD